VLLSVLLLLLFLLMFGTPAFVGIPAAVGLPTLACIPNVVNIPLLMVFSLLMVSLPLLTSPHVPFVSCAGFGPTVPVFITANVLLKFSKKILKKNRLSPAVALNPVVTISVGDLYLDPDPKSSSSSIIYSRKKTLRTIFTYNHTFI
jgi:hypothetical protein